MNKVAHPTADRGHRKSTIQPTAATSHHGASLSQSSRPDSVPTCATFWREDLWSRPGTDSRLRAAIEQRVQHVQAVAAFGDGDGVQADVELRSVEARDVVA